MQIFVCPRDQTRDCRRFTPDHMVTLQNPGADVSAFRPPWVPEGNHYVAFFCDAQFPVHPHAPTREDVAALIGWLTPRCQPESEAKILIHCDAGMGRSPAAGYIAWCIHLGVGHEWDAFEHLKESCAEPRIVPNPIVVSHADAILGRGGALRRELDEWGRRVPWSRTFG